MFDETEGIDAHAGGAAVADTRAIRFTLDKIGEMEMWQMQDRGWKGGPWTRSPEEFE